MKVIYNCFVSCLLHTLGDKKAQRYGVDTDHQESCVAAKF